jgi:hypothetical protein
VLGRVKTSDGVAIPDEPSEEQVTAALRAACLHDTSESRKDMRKALVAAAGVAASDKPVTDQPKEN